MSSSSFTRETQLGLDLCDYVAKSPSAFHATQQAAEMFKQHGFKEISERDSVVFTSLAPGARVFFTRNQSSIVAMAIGGKWKPGNGFAITAAHTDSPCLKVKPLSKITKSGFLQVGVAPYGGGLWSTWFDRDLSLAGRVVVASTAESTPSTTYESVLVDLEEPLLRIPNLAIHLNREVNDKGFAPNKERELLPILASQLRSELAGDESKSSEHHGLLLQRLSDKLTAQLGRTIQPEHIRDVELSLYDTQRPQLGGAHREFVFSARLDNLCMSYLSARSLIASLEHQDDSPMVLMSALFDNEEIGSESMQGAASNLMSQRSFFFSPRSHRLSSFLLSAQARDPRAESLR